MSGGWITRAHEANQQERIDTELHPWPSCILISDTLSLDVCKSDFVYDLT